MIKFYRTHRTLIVHDTELDMYAPFTLEDKPVDFRGLMKWWQGRRITNYLHALPEHLAEYKAMGMIQIN